MKRIIVTGALGHIGSKLIRELPASFPTAEIVMVDNLRTNRYCSLFNLPEAGLYSFIEGDVLTLNLPDIFRNADVVIHLAAITDAANSFAMRDEVEKVNYHGTVRVAEACIASGCSLIHMSSTSVYGTQKAVVDENCPPEDLQPQSPYAETKLKEEAFLKSAQIAGKLGFVTLRNGTICGVSPGMRFHTAVNKFCWQALMGQPLTVWRTALHQRRPYLCLSDSVNAVIFLIQNRIFDGNTYNVVTENLTVSDIIEFIRCHVAQLKIDYVDSAVMNQLSYTVSGQRFRSLGFGFSGKPEDDVRDTVDLLRKAGVSGLKRK